MQSISRRSPVWQLEYREEQPEDRRYMTTPTLHLCVVAWSGLVPSNWPLLEDWAEVFEEEWQTEVSGLGTLCIRFHKKLGAIRRIVMWQHLYRTVWSRDLRASKIKCLGDLRIKHAHHLSTVSGPSATIKQLPHIKNLNLFTLRLGTSLREQTAFSARVSPAEKRPSAKPSWGDDFYDVSSR